MDVKALNSEPNPLKEKIVSIGETPFKLWLEFEETSPWDDITNDFVNIGVDTLDGRSYGINTWTYKFLERAVNYDVKNGAGGNRNYMIPPDLFVKELSRDCIEQVIAELLDRGELEKLLNESIFFLNFIDPWIWIIDLVDLGDGLLEELKKEIHPNHPLFGKDFDIKAKRKGSNLILVELDKGEMALANLTLSGKMESGPFPEVSFYANPKDFWNRYLKEDIANSRKARTD